MQKTISILIGVLFITIIVTSLMLFFTELKRGVLINIQGVSVIVMVILTLIGTTIDNNE